MSGFFQLVVVHLFRQLLCSVVRSVEGKRLFAFRLQFSHLYIRTVIMAAIFLRFYIVLKKLVYCCRKAVYPAGSVLVLIAFCRTVSDVFHLILIFRQYQLQAKPGHVREGHILVGIQCQFDLTVCIDFPKCFRA